MDRNKRNIPDEIIYLISAVLVLFISLIGFSNLVTPAIGAIFSPIMSVSAKSGNMISSTYDSLGQLNDLRKERNDLLVENAKIKAENAIVIQMKDQIELLKKEVSLEIENLKVVEAEVLSNKDEQVSEFLIVNKGSSVGVYEGGIARIGNLFLGTVDQVDRSRSRIKLPTQGRSSLEVIIIPKQKDMMSLTIDQIGGLVSDKETRVWKGVALGGSTGIMVENIEKNATIKNGDHVIVNDQDVGVLLYLGDVGDINLAPSDVGVSASVVTPINYRNILNLIIHIE